MTLRFSALNIGHSVVPPLAPKPKKQHLPIEIQLGSNAVKLTPEGWRLDSAELSKAHGECQRLEEGIHRLRRELESCREEAKQSAERENMAQFQNQLLIDMLAVARADEGKFKTRLGQEGARHAELSRSLQQAYTRILAAGLDPGVSEAP
ncbi:unnamed protein product [Hapterophycus canaliculatus]